ncbi:MAG: hypothetical protein ACRDRG_08675 [Pseudonocardiaceae bacterium]
MIANRLVAAVLAVMLGAALINVLPGTPAASAAQGDTPPSDSAMTLSGEDEFADLKVTVSQTKDLINQVVTVAWEGGEPTLPTGGGGFFAHYLQIMQCWGDDPGPDRTQCQFGAAGSAATLSAGDWVRGRQLTYPFTDPKEKLELPAGSPGGIATVPFWPVGRPKPEGAVPPTISDFFDRQTTNEVSLAPTYENGSGEAFFEIQTTRQAAGLGCGDPVITEGTTTGRKCWLVVVPRGSTEVDGTPRSGITVSKVDSSPLSQSNWDNRIVFPLEFVPVRQACPLGAPERRVVGHELAVDAVSRWQPALCEGGGALYSYTQVPDDIARNQVVEGASPGLALMTGPILPDQAPPDRPLVYAPVALSGLAIAFNIERQTNSLSSPEQQLLNGQRFVSMKLTPRLVAKLLTQSYQGAVAGFGTGRVVPEYLRNNPTGLTRDPEFLELNPDYEGFATINQPPDALVQLGGSDLTSLLWSWVKADPDASAFLTGTPDPHGMVVNPENRGLTLPQSVFPRNDQSCVEVSLLGATGTSCTLDVHPFFTDMHEAALSASRGDSGARNPAPDGATVVLKKNDRQSPGQRALLAVVDAATADRYSLPTANLLNTAGEFVTPSAASLLAGTAAMKPSSVPDVLSADPVSTDPAAYPLTALSYAVASPTTLDAAAGKDYAAFLRYAAGPGQQLGAAPGQLPFGMAPLPEPLRAQALAAAATIEAQATKTPSSTPAGQPAGAGNVPRSSTSGGAETPSGDPGAAPGTDDTTTNSGGAANPSPGGVAAQPNGAPAAKVPSVVQQPVAAMRRTPALPTPAVGALLVTILICGVLAAASAPVLQSPALRRLGVAVRRRMPRGVMPPGQ